MIDYEKLRLAHELCQKLMDDYFANFIMIGSQCGYTISNSEGPIKDNPFFVTESLDKFISKLTELTEPQPKYKVGDEVWISEDSCPDSYLIDGIAGRKYYLSHPYNHGLICESLIYPTKEALIDAKIEYWAKLKLDDMNPKFEGEIKSFNCVEERTHEHDGNSYVKTAVGFKRYTPDDATGPDWHFKCKKCGTFYR